jgi:hypothetical protein
MLYPTPALSEAGYEVLGRIDETREDLRHQVQANPAKWVLGLRK